MRIVEFQIKNFKGIKSTTIEVTTKAPGNIITLIGLNESGKTTILEAISNFISVDSETSSIVRTVSIQHRPIDLIPKSLETNFTGRVSVKAILELDQEDKLSLSKYLRDQFGVDLEMKALQNPISVSREYDFKDSVYTRSASVWNVGISYKQGRGKKIYKASRNSGEGAEIWDKGTDFLQERFPKIVYFPTFLFSVPDRIYLEDFPGQSETDEAFIINRYFRQVLQDVADSIGSDISLERHIVDRVKRHRDNLANPLQFLAKFMNMDEASQIRAVTNKLANRIGRVVFSAWNEISGRNIIGKSVRIDWGTDANVGNIPYLQILIHDGENYYSLHERSLGFRWFFTFLLFTHFRASRRHERSTVFLFDEPASNLHALAQTKLVESFGRIANGNKYIIYSTHSHYMIDPIWLEKAFIVQNTAVDFHDADADADDIFQDRETDIRATRYRMFVAQNPTRVSYFQPALDALRYSFGPMVPGKQALIVEGKFDFHPLIYFQRRFASSDFMIIPAPSASEAGTLISLLRGLGTSFIVLLDDDRPGKNAAKNYSEHHLLNSSRILTLGDIVAECKGKPFEALYGDAINSLINPGSSQKPTKGEYSLFFQGLIVSNDFHIDLGSLEHKVKMIIEKITERLKLS